MTTSSQDMVIVHRVFRREFALLPALLRDVADGDTERVERLGDHVRLLLDVLDHHHAGEDLLLWPRLRERAPERVALFDAMDADHTGLHELLGELAALLVTWRGTAAASDAQALADAVEALGPPLLAHLDREEDEVLPLIDALLTQEEWNALGERAFAALDPADAMIVLAQMGEESPAAEWEWFMTHLPPFVQDAYRDQALPAYRAYVAAVRGT
jgi:hemerythrin-like domain-containing protein